MISIIFPMANGTDIEIPLDMKSNPTAAARRYFSGRASWRILLKSVLLLALLLLLAEDLLLIINISILFKFVLPNSDAFVRGNFDKESL